MHGFDLHMHIGSKLIFLFFFTLSVHQGIAQKTGFLKVDTTRYIVWSDERPLTWSDYRLLKSDTIDLGITALTAVTHSVRGGIEKGKPNFEVYVLFKKRRSWTTSRSDSLLFEHERLHFDLAELYGRKLRKQIAAMGSQNEKRLSAYRKKIKILLEEFKRKSALYDYETVHGEQQIKQAEWRNYVSYEMQRLHKYK
ncbi:DUF922 domain-containing protein [Roseivirga misakiensis]|uniref:DUF922 domain-containing protein n=1 Tax=Roseivirga misakiensis TaxID=1563681 RepID=A0A1E5T0B6_9BACT|nr:DUF922 domain-containing protein [Roseivirga misakiensis]OEK04813.1 hypothetical protein BFP71_15340 [Roseivirga misakiensis]